jgi:hypothetical protein
MEKSVWADQVRNEEVLPRQGKEYSKNNGKKEGYLVWTHCA